MTQERKSDLVCSCCERELKWRGSIMDGKMVCTTSWCVKNDEHQSGVNNYTTFEGEKVTINTAVGVNTFQGYIDKLSGGSSG